MTWRAAVTEDFPSNAVRLHVALTLDDDRSDFILQIGPGRETTRARYGSAQASPEGMLIPRDAIEAIRDALDKYLGAPHDDYRSRYEEARDALEVERRRIDALLVRLPVIDARPPGYRA